MSGARLLLAMVHLSVFGKRVIRIAIEPAFARLRGSDHRVSAGASMFAGVLIRRAVAAQGHSAFLARSQMHPACADFYAFATLEMRRMFHLGYRGKMSTAFVSHDLHRPQVLVNKLDRHRAFSDSRGNPFDRA